MTKENPQVATAIEELIRHLITWKGDAFSEAERAAWEEENRNKRAVFTGELDWLIEKRIAERLVK